VQLINHRYTNQEQLQTFINDNIPSSGSLLIQLFSGVMSKAAIQPIVDLLVERLPHASLIGATTAGEIMDGKMSSFQIIISFSLFEATDVTTYYYPQSDYEYGVRAAREILSDRSKACIAFSEGLKSDSESFLNGFTSVRNDVMIAGGNAGDDLTFTRTYVIKGNTIYDEGIVIAVLDSDVLHVHNAYSLNWTSVGKEMTITKADKNVIYEIDGRPIRELYTHYLSAETVARVPASAIEFPLIKIEDGVRIARSIIAKTEDGGFVYAGHFHNGEKVRFAIGNVDEILNHAADIRDTVASAPVEATYIYSCSVRKLFVQEQLNYEFGLINEIAPTAGFFTYGEFFHSPSNNQLLNITTTTLSLSELKVLASCDIGDAEEYRHSMLKSLTYLINVTQDELDNNIKFLDQYKMVLDESSIVSKTDANGVINYVNDAFCEISGYAREELIGKRHSIVRHPDNPPELFKELWETVKVGKVWKNTFKNLSKSGTEYYVKSVVAPIFDDKGEIVEYIAARMDVTELIVKDRIIQRQLIDELTGLKNRTALFADLENSSKEPTLVVLNIDRFSNINDYFGYEVGDSLLKAFAQDIDDLIEHNLIYRISGDEFVFICIDELDSVLKERIVEYVNNLESRKFKIGTYDISVKVSGGVAHADKAEVYNLAHIALKEAKEKRAKVIFFNDNRALSEKTHNNIMVVNTIQSAIEDDRIIPYFQGIVDNRTRTVTKYEALIRMIDTDGKVISPFFFLEHAKKSKLYDKLTRIMIAKTFAVFEELEYEFSINLTLHDIMSEETRAFICETLDRSSAASRLVFEIVETEEIENFSEVIEFIKTVKAHGCKIAIDDFGTGYSNFSYLSKLDVDYIKIDGSLIKNINIDEDYLLTVESILHFAQKKKIATIAEFVEDEAIFAKLVELGIDYSQGYLFSVPAPTL
jgi:c-di-GMP phosphodiesterase